MVLHAQHTGGFKAKQVAYILPILFWLKVVLHIKHQPSELWFYDLQHYSGGCCALQKARVIGSGSALAISFAAWRAAVSVCSYRYLINLSGTAGCA